MAIAIENIKYSFIKSAVTAGLIAGIAFLAVEMVSMTLAAETDAWLPVRLIASLLIGKDVMLSALLYGLITPETPAIFTIGVLVMALLLHLTMSVVLSTIIGALCRVKNIGLAISIGAGCGLAIYLINFYGISAIYPWFEKGRGVISLFSHIVYGTTSAYVFVKMHYHRTTEITAGAQMA